MHCRKNIFSETEMKIYFQLCIFRPSSPGETKHFFQQMQKYSKTTVKTKKNSWEKIRGVSVADMGCIKCIYEYTQEIILWSWQHNDNKICVSGLLALTSSHSGPTISLEKDQSRVKSCLKILIKKTKSATEFNLKESWWVRERNELFFIKACR